MKLLRTHRIQLVIILSLFFFLLNVFAITFIAILPKIFSWIVPFVVTLVFALLLFFVLFIWKKRAVEMVEMRSFLDSLVEGIVMIDRDLKVCCMNQRAAAFFSVIPESVIGHSFASIEKTACLDLVKEAFVTAKPVTAMIKSKQLGAVFDVTALFHKNPSVVVLMIQDRTYAHKVAELAQDFIANASHELKTPITIVRGFAETLSEHPELSSEIRQEITSRILDNCERMVSLVKNLLTLAAIDESIPGERLRKCDPKEVAEMARATIVAIHPSAEIIIKQEGELRMKVDMDLLLQALINLLDNAVKYSGEKAKVEIEVTQDSKVTRVAVRDFGRGIASKNLEHIFERFYAVDKTLSRKLGGYGLGLSIVQRIVEKHHGHIDVVSKEGVGTTFTLTFPIRPLV